MKNLLDNRLGADIRRRACWRQSRLALMALPVGLTLASAPAVYAQDAAGDQAAPNDDAIVVTAQRRSELSRDVPISVTNLSTQQLTSANVDSLADTARISPGLRFDSVQAFAQPTIRGVGTAVSTAGGGPNVGIYVDGFFQSNPLVADFELLNVKSIQVLKGPQGTLFGRNTTGGAILVTTNDPDVETHAEMRASYARFHELNLQGYATTGLGENVAVDIEGRYKRGDGFRTNIVDGNDRVSRFENWSVRAGAKIQLSPAVSALIRFTHSNTHDPTSILANSYVDRDGSSGFLDLVSSAGKAFYGRTDTKGLPLVYYYAPSSLVATRPNEVAATDRVDFRNKSNAIQATVTADLGFADLVSYSLYRKDDALNNSDLDSTALPFFYLIFPVANRTISQEFLLNSKPGSRLQWTAGAIYYRNRDTWGPLQAGLGGAPTFQFGGSSATAESFAGFLDMTYEVSSKFFVTVGGRYSHDKVINAYFLTNPFTTSYEGANGQPVSVVGLPSGSKIELPTLTNNRVTPRLVVRYKPTEESSIYASYTRGYKAGIYNVGGLSAVPVKPEDIDAFEAGYKYGDRLLSFDVAAFYYDYRNLQVSSFQAGAAQIRNAASSEIYGLEAQVTYRMSPGFSINAGAAYTHARYKAFPNAPFVSYCDPSAAPLTALWCVPQALGGFGPGALVQTTVDAKGFHMQRTPEFTGNIGMSYETDLGGGRLQLSGNLYYSSSFFFDATEQFKQRGFETLSARIQWTDPSDRFTLAIFGDNLTNDRHLNQVLSNTIGTGAGWNSPVSYGAQLTAKF